MQYQESFLEVCFAHLLSKTGCPHERYWHADLWRKPHSCFSIHAHLLFKNSEIFETAVAIPTHILCILSALQLLQTGSCIGYLHVITCDNSSLPGTIPKPPCCLSAWNSSTFGHDCSPYQACSKQLTLGRKKKRACGCLYTGDKGSALPYWQVSRGHRQMVTLCWSSSENAFSSININGSCHF